MASNFINSILVKYCKKLIQDRKPFVVIIASDYNDSLTRKAIYQVLSDKYPNDVWIGEEKIATKFDFLSKILNWKTYSSKIKKRYCKYLIFDLDPKRKFNICDIFEIVKPDVIVLNTQQDELECDFLHQEENRPVKIIVNCDIKSLNKVFQNAISFGIKSEDADYRVENIEDSDASGAIYRLVTKGQSISIKSSLGGEKNIYSEMIGFVVGQILGIQSLQVKKSLESISSLELK